MLFSSSSLCPFDLQFIILYVFGVWYLRHAETGLNVKNADSTKNKSGGSSTQHQKSRGYLSGQ